MCPSLRKTLSCRLLRTSVFHSKQQDGGQGTSTGLGGNLGGPGAGRGAALRRVTFALASPAWLRGSGGARRPGSRLGQRRLQTAGVWGSAGFCPGLMVSLPFPKTQFNSCPLNASCWIGFLSSVIWTFLQL